MGVRYRTLFSCVGNDHKRGQIGRGGQPQRLLSPVAPNVLLGRLGLR